MKIPEGPLSQDEIQHFVDFGFVKMEAAFDVSAGSLASKLVDFSWERLAYDPDDPATWLEPRVHLPSHNFMDVDEFAPRAAAAFDQLMGGPERVKRPMRWSDSFIYNFSFDADRPWAPPSADVGGWHKDGDFFVHFLDSPEQGLLTLVLWDDVVHQGGPTYMAVDSVARVAAYLRDRPEGVLVPSEEYGELCRLASQCHDFREATGKAGDVFILHPFMLHTASQNMLRRPRIISNPPISFSEPMCFDRADDAYSAVEQAILNGLGLPRLSFEIASERRFTINDGQRSRNSLKDEIDARFKALGRSTSIC